MNIIKDIKKFIINKLNKSDRNINQTQENLKQKQYNDNIENKEKINEIIDALETVDSNITNINTNLNNKVSKSGDTLTGELLFVNKNDYGAIRKTRTIDGADYTLSVGVGANKSARVELYTGQGNVGQLDVKNDGTIWNGKTSRRLLEDVIIAQANANLNDYNQTGLYYFPTGGTITNVPAGVNGWLLVINSASVGAIKQIWFRHGTVNTNDFETYVRTSSGTWSNWKKIQTLNNFLEAAATNTSTYFSTIDFNKAVKSGNVVNFNFRGLVKTNIPSGTTFLVLPYSAVNATSFSFALHTGTQYTMDTPVWAYLNAGENARCSGVTAGKWMHINITYITED